VRADVEAQDIKVVRGMLLGRVGSRVNLAIQRGLDQKYEVLCLRAFFLRVDSFDLSVCTPVLRACERVRMPRCH
jgi:hypothetical protein